MGCCPSSMKATNRARVLRGLLAGQTVHAQPEADNLLHTVPDEQAQASPATHVTTQVHATSTQHVLDLCITCTAICSFVTLRCCNSAECESLPLLAVSLHTAGPDEAASLSAAGARSSVHLRFAPYVKCSWSSTWLWTAADLQFEQH